MSVGSVPAIEPGAAVLVVVAVPGSVNAVVVSMFVAVMTVVVTGGVVCSGPLIVDVMVVDVPS